MDCGRFKCLTVEEVEGIFLALYQCTESLTEDANKTTDYARVAELSPACIRDGKDAMEFLMWYKATYGVGNLSEFTTSFVGDLPNAFTDLELEENALITAAVNDLTDAEKDLGVNIEDEVRTLMFMLCWAEKYVSYKVLLSEEAWKCMCGYARVYRYDLYKVCVEKQFTEISKILNAEEFVAHKDHEDDDRSPEYNRTVVENLRGVFEYVVKGEDKPRQLFLMLKDMKKVGEYVSYFTLASTVCYDYLGARFSKYYTSNDAHQQGLMQYIKAVGTYLDVLSPNDMDRVKKTYPNIIHNRVAVKFEMVGLMQVYGDTFGRHKLVRTDTEKGNYYIRQNCAAIFQGVYLDSATKNQKPSIERVILDLMRVELVSPTTGFKTWKNMFYANLHCFDSEEECLAYFLATKKQMETVLAYVSESMNPTKKQ